MQFFSLPGDHLDWMQYASYEPKHDLDTVRTALLHDEQPVNNSEQIDKEKEVDLEEKIPLGHLKV